MIVGIPKEIKNNENRVSILPFGVEDLKKSGHAVLVQSQAKLEMPGKQSQYLLCRWAFKTYPFPFRSEGSINWD